MSGGLRWTMSPRCSTRPPDFSSHDLARWPRCAAAWHQRAIGKTLVDAAIERLLALQYLDDDAFARAWVESRDRAHPRGEHALRRELQLKGVERGVIEAVLDERRTSADGAATEGGERIDPDTVAAQRLLERNARTLTRVTDPRKRRQRAYTLLARSGFAPDVCSSVATAWLVEADGDATP